MRDLEYLNSIYESLEEGIGIKTTKLKPFYDSATGYESQRNPNTNHSELKNPTRRAVKYDYGKASYEEISAEEAVRLVKQDKHNIQKLRIIYRLADKESLVEYEVRDNGSVYAIYGSPNPISIDGKQYKNIRYAPWKKVLENADLIYITDEYDRYLDADPEVAQARADRNKYSQLALPADRTSPNFDPHHPYANAYTNGVTSRYDAPGRYVAHNVDTGAHKPIERYHSVVASALTPYLQALEAVRNAYQELDRYRRALRKLEADKDLLDVDEYERKHDKWTSSYQNAMQKHKEAIATLKKIEAKVDKQIDSRSAQFADKLRNNIYEYDNAITKGFELATKIRDLKAKLVGDLINDKGASYDLRQAENRVQSAAREIRRVKALLEDVLANMSNDEQAVQNAQDEVIAAANLFDERLSQVEALKLEALRRHLDQIEQVAQELRDIDVKLAELRPKAAAAKAARAAKNKTVELDPELVDILDFGDGEDNSDDGSSD